MADAKKEFEQMQEQISNMARKNSTNIDTSGYDEPTMPYVPPEAPQPAATSQTNEQQAVEHEPIGHEDEELFPNGPMISEVESWKKQFDAIYIVDDIPGDYVYIFRTINRFEYKSIMAQPNTDPLMREEMICQTCVLFPKEFSYGDMSIVDAGVPSIIAEHIMESSGFTKTSQPKRL